MVENAASEVINLYYNRGKTWHWQCNDVVHIHYFIFYWLHAHWGKEWRHESCLHTPGQISNYTPAPVPGRGSYWDEKRGSYRLTLMAYKKRKAKNKIKRKKNRKKHLAVSPRVTNSANPRNEPGSLLTLPLLRGEAWQKGGGRGPLLNLCTKKG